MSESKPPSPEATSADLVERVLAFEEGATFDTKRAGDNDRKLKTIVAFANTEGGTIAIGVEDAAKAKGRDRLFGVEENPEAVDELRKLITQRITPGFGSTDSATLDWQSVSCALRTGKPGTVLLLHVPKSAAVHSIVDGGTYVRNGRTNRQIAASEITELALKRGTATVVGAPVDVPFDLLDTATWREYAEARRLTRKLPEALQHLGLAKPGDDGRLRPTAAAVLLFAEEPGGLLDRKCAVRIFHYKGERVEHGDSPNLLRPPRTVTGPVIALIRGAEAASLDELATGVHVGPLGFEIAQKYPVRAIREAITNAVIHRDYRISADIHVRIFDDRIEVESPGLLPAPVTVANLPTIGSRPRNRAIVDHLREFPNAPNLDAGEGVRSMIEVMDKARLFPPMFRTSPDLPREAVEVVLRNEAKPTIWGQLSDYLDRHGLVGNREVRRLLDTEDSVSVSKLLKRLVELRVLEVANPDEGKRARRYRKAGGSASSLFTDGPGKQPPRPP